MSQIHFNKIEEAIRAKIRESSPGLFSVLELNCKRFTGKSCARLLLEEPSRLVEILESLYDEASVFLILRWNFINPILQLLGIDDYDLEEMLADMAINEPEEFLKKIHELLSQYFSS